MDRTRRRFERPDDALSPNSSCPVPLSACGATRWRTTEPKRRVVPLKFGGLVVERDAALCVDGVGCNGQRFQQTGGPDTWDSNPRMLDDVSPTPNSPPARFARSAVAEMHVRGFGSRRPLGTAIVLLRKGDYPPGGGGSQGLRKCRQRSATQAVFVGTPSTRGGSPVSPA